MKRNKKSKKLAKPSVKDPALNELQSDAEARVGQLKQEFANHPSKGLTPDKLHRILEAAEQGDLSAQSELFEDMEEKDPQIGADMAKRRQASAELEWQISAPDGANAAERKAADFCSEVFGGIEVEDLISDMGSAIGHGWANLELPWDREGNTRRICQPVFRPHSWFALDQHDQDVIVFKGLVNEEAQLWPLGWVQHRHKAKPGYVARTGLHRMLAWPYLFQNYALGDLAQLLEIYGLPAGRPMPKKPRCCARSSVSAGRRRALFRKACRLIFWKRPRGVRMSIRRCSTGVKVPRPRLFLAER